MAVGRLVDFGTRSKHRVNAARNRQVRGAVWRAGFSRRACLSSPHGPAYFTRSERGRDGDVMWPSRPFVSRALFGREQHREGMRERPPSVSSTKLPPPASSSSRCVDLPTEAQRTTRREIKRHFAAVEIYYPRSDRLERTLVICVSIGPPIRTDPRAL